MSERFQETAHRFLATLLPHALRRGYHRKAAKSRPYGYAPQNLWMHIVSGIRSIAGLLDACHELTPEVPKRVPDADTWQLILAAYTVHDLDKALQSSQPTQSIPLEQYVEEITHLRLDEWMNWSLENVQAFARILRAGATHSRDPERLDLLRTPAEMDIVREYVRLMDGLASAQTLPELQTTVTRTLLYLFPQPPPPVHPIAWRLREWRLPLYTVITDAMDRWQQAHGIVPVLIHPEGWISLSLTGDVHFPSDEWIRELQEFMECTYYEAITQFDTLTLYDTTDNKNPRIADFWILYDMDRVWEDLRTEYDRLVSPARKKELDRDPETYLNRHYAKYLSPESRAAWQDVIEKLCTWSELLYRAEVLYQIQLRIFATLKRVLNIDALDLWMRNWPPSRPLHSDRRSGGVPWQLFWIAAERAVRERTLSLHETVDTFVGEIHSRLYPYIQQLQMCIRDGDHLAVDTELPEYLQHVVQWMHRPAHLHVRITTTTRPKGRTLRTERCTLCGRPSALKHVFGEWKYTFHILPQRWSWKQGRPSGTLQQGTRICTICYLNQMLIERAAGHPTDIFMLICFPGTGAVDTPPETLILPGLRISTGVVYRPLPMLTHDEESNVPFKVMDTLASVFDISPAVKQTELDQWIAGWDISWPDDGAHLEALRQRFIAWWTCPVIGGVHLQPMRRWIRQLSTQTYHLRTAQSVSETAQWLAALWYATLWGMQGYRIGLTTDRVLDRLPESTLTVHGAPLSIRRLLRAYGLDFSVDEWERLSEGFLVLSALWVLVRWAAPHRSALRQFQWSPAVIPVLTESPLGGFTLWNRGLRQGQPPPPEVDTAAWILFVCHRHGGRHMGWLQQLAEYSLCLFRPYWRMEGFRHRATLLWRTAVRAVQEAHQARVPHEDLVPFVAGRLDAVLDRHMGSKIGYVQRDPETVHRFAHIVVHEAYGGDLARLRRLQNGVADYLVFHAYRAVRRSTSTTQPSISEQEVG